MSLKIKRSKIRRFIFNLIELTFQAQSKGAEHTAKYIIGKNLIHLNPVLIRPIPLDSTKEEDIADMIREVNHLFDRTFITSGVKRCSSKQNQYLYK